MEKTPLEWSKLGAHLTDPDRAREYMECLRWGNAGPACPHCGGADPYTITPKAGSRTRKGVYKCRIKECRKQFTVTVGTVFEDSHIALNKWLQAIYLMSGSKTGMSAHQLHRMLGVTYRSAWFMAHRLRYAMAGDPFVKLSGSGVVEVDETFVGGKRKKGMGRHPADGGRKAAVAVLVERGGRARAFPMEQIAGHTMGAAIHRYVDTAHAQVMTDDETGIYGNGSRTWPTTCIPSTRHARPPTTWKATHEMCKELGATF